MTLLALSTEETRDQILDIPLRSIARLNVSRERFSQGKGVSDIALELEHRKGDFCYLDASAIVLETVYVSVEVDIVRGMLEWLTTYYPKMKITQLDKDKDRPIMDQ